MAMYCSVSHEMRNGQSFRCCHSCAVLGSRSSMSIEIEDTSLAQSPLLSSRDAVERVPMMKKTLQGIGSVVHPNRITAARIPITALVIAADQISGIASAVTNAVNTTIDWLDGAVARSTSGKETKEGAMLDPYVDKISNTVLLAYQVATHIQDITFAVTAAVSVALNIAKQRKRGPLLQQTSDSVRAIWNPETCESVEKGDTSIEALKADSLGKIKQLLECTSITTMFAAGDNEYGRLIAVASLALSTALNAWSLVKKSVQRRTL